MTSKDLKNSEELELPVGSVLPENDNLTPPETESELTGLSKNQIIEEVAEPSPDPLPSPEPEPSSLPEPLSLPEPSPLPEPSSLPEPEPSPSPLPEPEPEPSPSPLPGPVPEVLPQAEPEFEPAPERELMMDEGSLHEPQDRDDLDNIGEVIAESENGIEEPAALQEVEAEISGETWSGQIQQAEEILISPTEEGQATDESVPEQLSEVPVKAENGEVLTESVPEFTDKEGNVENQVEVEEEIHIEEISAGNVLPETEIMHESVYEDVVLPVDYLSMSQIELVNLLREAVENEDSGHYPEVVVSAFYRKVREKNEELKKKYVEDGGKEDEYVAEEDPYDNDVRELLKKYKQQKFELAKKLDAEKEINLQKKYEIIEEIKNLLNKEESINRTFQDFRDYQRKWYEIGQVPQSKMKDLWDTYHFHVENFYDYIKINKELRDLDLKKNLEAKIEICEKTEELLVEPSVIKAFNALQKYHEEWREIGPVPTDKKEEIWERFKAATAKINQKHQDYFEKRKQDQKKNLDAKIALCEKAEEISNSDFETHREWDEKSRELVELQKVWKTIGFAPKKENNKIYDRFRSACDRFFTNKREFYSRNKDIQQTNLQMKIDLCLEAETLKESTDWKKTTQQFIDLQKRWKEIGAIPRKSSDAVWKRFRAACDYFFERKAVHFSEIDGEQYENLRLKEQLIAEVENFKADVDPSMALKDLRDLQRRWTEIGHVPLKNKDAVQHRFREAINRQFDALKIDNTHRSVFNFRNKIESLTDNARGLSKVRSEREKYMLKLKQLENDLTLLDNNIGFFANSKNAQALIADVNQKIRDTREKIEQLKEKIRIIDDLDKSEY